MTQTHLPSHWIEKLCAILSVDGWRTGAFPHQVVRLFTAWAQSEGGTAQWNPLNTTDHISDEFGAWQGTDYNSVGVCNFKNQWQGIVATAATLLSNQAFALLLEAIRSASSTGQTAEQIVQGHEAAIKTWGTNPNTILEVLKTTP